MSRSRAITVDFGVFEDPTFKPEPFSEREAWIWLQGEAASRPTSVRRNGVDIPLEPGQVVHSLRFMAQKWGWPEARVRRFLARLKRDARIDVAADAHSTVITLRRVWGNVAARSTTDAHGDATERRESIDSSIGSGNGEGDGPRAREIFHPRFEEVRTHVLGLLQEALGRPWRGSTVTVDQWLKDGYDPDFDIYPAFEDVMAGWDRNRPPEDLYTLDYFDGPIIRQRRKRTRSRLNAADVDAGFDGANWQGPATASSLKPHESVDDLRDGEPDRVAEVMDEIARILGVDPHDPPWRDKLQYVRAWLAQGYDPYLDICLAVESAWERRLKRGETDVPSLAYFDGPIAHVHRERTRPMPSAASIDRAVATAGSGTARNNRPVRPNPYKPTVDLEAFEREIMAKEREGKLRPNCSIRTGPAILRPS